MKQRLVLIAKIVLAVALITWLIRSGKLDFDKLRHIGDGWPWLIAAWAVFGFVYFLSAVRWNLFMRAQGIHYSLGDAYALSLISVFFSQVMLGSTGGDVIKAYMIGAEQKEQRSAAVITVFFDRAFGLFVLLAVALIASLVNFGFLLSNPELVSFALVIVAMFFCALTLTCLFYSKNVRSLPWLQSLTSRLPFQGFLAKLEVALLAFKGCPRTLWISLVISLVLHLCVTTSMLCAVFALVREPVDILPFFFLIPLTQIAMAIPITPGSIGTGEAAFSFLLSRVGIEQGSLVSILMRVVYLGWAAIGCICYLKRKRKVSNPSAEPSSPTQSESSSEATTSTLNDENDNLRSLHSSTVRGAS